MVDDEMSELEDFTEQLKEIRKNKGIDEKNILSNIKVGVINEKNPQTEPKKTTTPVQIPISTPNTNTIKNPPTNNNNNTEKKNNSNNNNKRDEDNFGCGLFKRGFLKRHKFLDVPTKNNSKKEKVKGKNSNEKKNNCPVDLSNIKSTPGTTTKTNILNTFSDELKQKKNLQKII